MSDELVWLDATAQADLVRAGEVAPIELVDAAIARIEAVDGMVNAVIIRRFEQARAEAIAALPDGPFRGVPFGFKDLGCATAGDPHHSGMRFLKELGWTEPTDSPLAAKFKAAGLVNVGRLNTPELGGGVTTEPLAHGPTRNPWSIEHMAGGSSGGSAAAVAAGMLPAAHASDGGGSIRIPASCCGVVGLKVSRGRIAGAGREDTELGFGVQGVVTRSVRDTAALLDAVHGSSPAELFSAPQPERPFSDEVGADPGQLRIGLLTHTPSMGADTDPECVTAAERTAEVLEHLGHVVERAYPVQMDDPMVTSAFSTFVTSGTRVWLENWAARTGQPIDPELLEPSTRGMAEFSKVFSAHDALSALQRLHTYRRDLAAWWDAGYDLLLTPTLPRVPLPLGVTSMPDDPAQGLMNAAPFVAYTSPFNITGQPAITLPLHTSASGLPIGVQLVAAYAREDLLLRVAAQLEVAVPWALRRPTI